MGSSTAPSLRKEFLEKPNFQDLTAVCPHCGALAGFISRGEIGVKAAKYRAGDPRQAHVGQCRSCSKIVLGLSYLYGEIRGDLLWPREMWPDQAPESLDPAVKKVYDEAREILALSPSAAATHARRCLQQVIRTKREITKKHHLFDEIEAAKGRDELTKPTRSALHHVREIGNWGAHPEVDQAATIVEVTPEEAEYTLQVLELLFHDLYVVPEQTDAMSAKIQLKKSGSGEQLVAEGADREPE